MTQLKYSVLISHVGIIIMVYHWVTICDSMRRTLCAFNANHSLQKFATYFKLITAAFTRAFDS